MSDQQFQLLMSEIKEVKENQRHHLEYHQRENLDARVAVLENEKARYITYKQLVMWMAGGSGVAAGATTFLHRIFGG